MYLGVIKQKNSVNLHKAYILVFHINFKNTGRSNDLKIYRITLTPILTKLIEAVLKSRIKPIVNKLQSPLQTGFTESASPIKCALLV